MPKVRAMLKSQAFEIPIVNYCKRVPNFWVLDLPETRSKVTFLDTPEAGDRTDHKYSSAANISLLHGMTVSRV